MKLILPRDLGARIEEEARAAFPRECCGLIEGMRHEGFAEAVALHAARNIATRADRFEIDPENHFTALKAARAHGRVLVGCYHSHPGGSPVPSLTDGEGAQEEDFFWLIAALPLAAGPVTIGAFAYCAAGFLSVALNGPAGADLVTSSE